MLLPKLNREHHKLVTRHKRTRVMQLTVPYGVTAFFAPLVLGEITADGVPTVNRKGNAMPTHFHQLLEHIIAHHQAVVAHIHMVIQHILANLHHPHR
jgi:hypothetical protein